jgi:class 3 adenylate cyclase
MATIQNWVSQHPHIADFVSPLINLDNISTLDLAKKLYALHEFMFAYDVVNTGLKNIRQQFSKQDGSQGTDNDVLSGVVKVDEQTRLLCLQLKQLEGRLYVQMKSHDKALAVFKELASLGFNDEETLGNLASCYKTQALTTDDKELSQAYLHEAYLLYQQAFKCSPQSYWVGINAATLALLLGQVQEANLYCQQVYNYCKDLAAADKQDYWLSATLAEAKLIDYLLTANEDLQDELLAAYQQAVAIANNFTQIASTRKNASLLLSWHYPAQNLLVVDETQRTLLLDKLLAILFTPPVLVFTGHMIDAAERTTPRFPAQNEDLVKQTLQNFMLESKVLWGYASAACGADILFLEAMQQFGLETNIILPYQERVFIKQSVARNNPVLSEKLSWEQRFQQVKHYTESQAGVHLWNSSIQFFEGSNLYYRYANLVIYGLALLKAKQLDAKLLHLAVWNGEKNNDVGGTFDAISCWWEKEKQPVYYINPLQPDKVQKFEPLEPVNKPQWNKPLAETNNGEVVLKSIVFTDVAGYSQFTEKQILIFQTEVVETIAKLIDDDSSDPEIKNTWGDALYLIFSDHEYAGNFALALSELIEERNRSGYWAGLGLPSPLQIRIALHFGPVFSAYDAILQKKTYIGNHVSNAARIEPITPPGEVYASVGAATFAEVLGIKSFVCDYVGRVPLAKNYGVFSLFRVRRSSQIF